MGQGGVEVKESGILRIVPGGQGVFSHQPSEVLLGTEALQILFKQLHQGILIQQDLTDIAGIVGAGFQTGEGVQLA